MHLWKDPQSTQPRPRVIKRRVTSTRGLATTQLSTEMFNLTELKLAQLEQEVLSNQSRLSRVCVLSFLTFVCLLLLSTEKIVLINAGLIKGKLEVQL